MPKITGKKAVVLAIAGLVACVLIGGLYIGWRGVETGDNPDAAGRYSKAWIEETIAGLESGESSVHIRASVHADRVLERIKGMSQVEEVILEYASSLSDDGLTQLTKLPNLRALDFRGVTHFSDANIGILTGCRNLQSLGIKSSNVTSAGLSTIAELPKLREFRHSGQFTAEALQKLQGQKPDCKISQVGWKD